MNETKLKLLELADHSTACEYPPNFDYDVSMRRVEILIPKLNAIAQKSFEQDTNVQDASFFTELKILEPPITVSNIYHYVLGIRFSSFGNFFTVWSNSAIEKVADEKINKLIAEIEANGFIYIDVETLDQKYTGKNKYLANISNWWLSYFDYL